jgi:hypothetical protein
MTARLYFEAIEIGAMVVLEGAIAIRFLHSPRRFLRTLGSLLVAELIVTGLLLASAFFFPSFWENHGFIVP